MSQTRKARPSKPSITNTDTAFLQTTPPPAGDIIERLEAAQEQMQDQSGPCSYGCSCPACMARQCKECWVDNGKVPESERRRYQPGRVRW